MLAKMWGSLKVSYRKCKHILVDAMDGFWEDDCYTKSSTLTFYTLQSIVPFLAFILGIAKGFGFEQYLENLISKAFQEQQDVTNYAIQIAYNTLQHIREGVVVGVGILFLIWAIINLLSYIEIVLNQIWKIKVQRSFLRKVNDYVATVIICPLIFIVSSSLTIYLKTRIASLQGTPLLDTISAYLLLSFKIVPLILSWLLFFLLYFLMPNTKLRVWPRIIAAILAGSVFQLWQIFYINFQVQIFNYNTVYGTFAVLPLFLIWLQFSWLIALAGAEIASSIENVIFYDKSSNQTIIQRKQLGLLILNLCLETFYTRETPLTEMQIAKKIKIPLQEVRKMLAILTDGKIVVPVEKRDGTIGYNPFCDPGCLTIKQVCDVIDLSSDFEISVNSSEPLEKINDFLSKLDASTQSSDANIKLNELFSLSHKDAKSRIGV